MPDARYQKHKLSKSEYNVFTVFQKCQGSVQFTG